MYTDDKNAQVVLQLLKKYGISKIVVSPGTTNVPIARSVQNDKFFQVYSVVDERSAGYFATGLAFASGEPVVISCTGATASRNYLSALTEAYYRKLPVIALTSQHHTADFDDLVPQLTDRRNSQNDIKVFDADLPYVKTLEDLKACILQVNKALHYATVKGGGPVHINLPVSPAYSFTTKKLPNFTKIEYFSAEDLASVKELVAELSDKKIGIFIGAHKPFDKETLAAMESFVKKTNAAVFYDHTSSYTGKNRILTSQIADLKQTKNKPDILIDMGSICGDYSASLLFKDVITWRISEDGKFHNRLNVEKLKKVFECSEKCFFLSMVRGMGRTKFKSKRYYNDLAKEVKDIKAPVLPLSNTYIAGELAKQIPKNSYLHLGILNSLRNMDFYEVDKTVKTSANVGGFGIDGALSTVIGQSMVEPDKLAFCLLGDLAFFYDMNALGVRQLSQNVRILVVNNGRGVEFRLNPRLESQWGEESDDYIAAAGHNGSVKAWVESQGCKYMTANSKEEFNRQMKDFCNKDVSYFGAPVVFEVFTTAFDEQQALNRMRQFNHPIRKAA